MPIEFDPATSSYYPVVYSGQSVERPVQEESPPPQEAAPAPEDSESYLDQPPPPEDPAQQANAGYPYNQYVGSIVDEVV